MMTEDKIQRICLYNTYQRSGIMKIIILGNPLNMNLENVQMEKAFPADTDMEVLREFKNKHPKVEGVLIESVAAFGSDAQQFASLASLGTIFSKVIVSVSDANLQSYKVYTIFASSQEENLAVLTFMYDYAVVHGDTLRIFSVKITDADLYVEEKMFERDIISDLVSDEKNLSAYMIMKHLPTNVHLYRKEDSDLGALMASLLSLVIISGEDQLIECFKQFGKTGQIKPILSMEEFYENISVLIG